MIRKNAKSSQSSIAFKASSLPKKRRGGLHRAIAFLPAISKIASRDLITLLILWALIFLGHGWEDGQKMDAMTNSVLAKHVLSTGDWKVFHYARSAYPDYYPHPPLAIWAEAVVFKVFGISDFTARISPAFFALGTILGTFLWGLLSGSRWLGFLASLILLSSTRYFKYAGDAFLEGPLAFFFVWGAVVFLSGRKSQGGRRLLFFLLFGMAVGLAFLTKSIFALALPMGVAGFYLFRKKTVGEIRDLFIAAAVGAAVVVGLWFYLGSGWAFLRFHWLEIKSRAVGQSAVSDHLGPTFILARTYWPWLPFFLFAAARMVRRMRQVSDEALLALMVAAAVFCGFTYSGFVFEHYLVPFFPMAAIVTAYEFQAFLLKFRPGIERYAFALAVTLATVLAVMPIRLHQPRAQPLKTALTELAMTCHGQKGIWVSSRLMDRWMALAIVLWESPQDAASVDPISVQPAPGVLLITENGSRPAIGWEKVPLRSVSLELYQPRGSGLCS